MDLRDRVALVIGATGGLGAVTARMLAEAGTHVGVTHFGHRDDSIEVCCTSRPPHFETIP